MKYLRRKGKEGTLEYETLFSWVGDLEFRLQFYGEGGVSKSVSL